MKQFLLYLTKIAVPVKTKFLVSIFLLGFFSINAQNAIVGPGFSTGWGGVSCPTGNIDFKYLAGNVGGTFGVATAANGTGDQLFRFGVDGGGTFSQLTITPGSDVDVVPNTTYSLNTSCTPIGAMKYNVPSTSYNYVFKTLDAGTNPTGTFAFFEVQGAVRSVTAVEQSPLAANVTPCLMTTVMATLDDVLSTGQKVYLRYTNDAWTNSTVVEMTGSGTSYTGIIPSSSNTPGAIVSYYVFTSGNSGVATNGSNADLYTINLKINGASNYTYTVAAGGATTAIPDDAFEQALIDLNLDCDIDGQVYTSNISGVTILDVRDKGITNLDGIEGFTSLEELYCNNEVVYAPLPDIYSDHIDNDNAITTLDVSGFPNLIRLYCENNQITNLNISGLTKLEALDTSNNPFLSTTLDVHLNPNLYYLVCQNNGLTDLDISGLTRLQTLIVWVNQLTSLDVSNNPDLSYLDCDENAFEVLDVSALKKLNQFYCSGNLLTSLDVRGLTNLGSFYCSNNPLTCILVDDVNAAIIASTTIDPDLGSPYTFWEKDSGAAYSYCSCNSPITWNGTSWSNGTGPTSETDAIIAGAYSQSAPISACSLTINNNAVVVIPSGTNVTLNAPIIITSGSFTLSNNANLVQTNKNSINAGAITVNRNSSLLKLFDFTLWSSPVSGIQTLADFSPLTSQDPSRFYSFDPTYNIGGVNGEYIAITTPTSSTFAAGSGYLIRMPNTTDAVTPTAFSGVFTGLPNNGNVPVALVDGLAMGLRYNLVGNPYPSTVNMTQFVADNSSNIESTLYFWRKTNGVGTAYCTWAPAVSPATGTFVSNGNTQSVDPLGVLQTGQGFFVEAKSGATSLTFNNSQRVADNAGQFFKTKQVVDTGRVWLNATNTTGSFSQMAVTYSAQATQGVDIYDAKYINDSKFALTSNINNGEYTIQSRPSFDTTDVVALNFKAANAGDYTISIDHVDGLFATDQDIYLVDSKTGAETNLKTSPYNFTAGSGVDNTRFSLKYQKTLKVDAATFNDNSVKVYINDGTLYVNSSALAISNIKIFDIQGRLIKEQKNIKATTSTISNLRVSNQVLIVQVRGEDNSEVTKKVMN